MKKNYKKLVALFMTLAMVISLAGCKKTTEENKPTDNGTVQETKPTTEETPTKEETPTEDKEVVTIKWVAVGSGMPTNYDAWKNHINSYLEEKIGVNIEFEVVSWGDWDNRRSVIVNTNEDYDILFTNLNTFAGDVNLGAFMDISDIVKNQTPNLYSYIPESYWEASSIGGKIYAVPTYKDSSVTQYFVWDKELLSKYNLDVSGLHKIEDLTEALTTIKDGEKAPSFVLHKDGLVTVVGNYYDGMGAGLMPVGVNFTDESRKVVSTLEQPEVMAGLKQLHQWYKDGIINSDAATLAEAPKYRKCFVAQGWSGAAITTWGPQMGVEAIAIQYGDTIVSNDSVQGSMNCISSSSKHPDKALQLLELVNTDPYVRDALYYGLEGENFKYTADGKIEKINEEWTMAGYTQGTFFNVSQLATADFNQWEEVQELNANATPSVLLGTSFDWTLVEDELANCIEIWNRYKPEVFTGTTDPETTIPVIMEELRAAGFDRIVEEAQKQIDAAK